MMGALPDTTPVPAVFSTRITDSAGPRGVLVSVFVCVCGRARDVMYPHYITDKGTESDKVIRVSWECEAETPWNCQIHVFHTSFTVVLSCKLFLQKETFSYIAIYVGPACDYTTKGAFWDSRSKGSPSFDDVVSLVTVTCLLPDFFSINV